MRIGFAVRLIAIASVLAVAALCATAHRAAAAKPHNLSVYTRAEEGQFIDKSDDRTRGEGKNPFGTFSDTYSINQSEAKGPFPGDETTFSINIYRDASLKSRVGTAVFFCQYSFAKGAFCDASFSTAGGTLQTDGQLDFNASSFSLAVVGGTGSYKDVQVGTVTASPSALHAEHLIFQLQ